MQTDEKIRELGESVAFRSLIRRRVRMCFLLSALMTLVFFAYFIAIAWFPGWMASFPFASGSVSIGIWFTVIAVVFAIGISGFYIWWAHNHYDAALKKLLEEHGYNG